MNHFDYGKTMMLKIGIGSPDNKGGCNLVNTFEQVLEKIRICSLLLILTPWYSSCTGGTGVGEAGSAKIRLEPSRIGSIHIAVA